MYLFLHILRRLGLGIGAYVAVFTYYNPSMATSNAQAIAFGVALVAFSLPGIPRMPRKAAIDVGPGRPQYRSAGVATHPSKSATAPSAMSCDSPNDIPCCAS